MIPWTIAELVPHSGTALLVDEVESFDVDGLIARSTIKRGGLYSQEDGSLPAWLGLEIMAQTVAAWAGCHARKQGIEVSLGFLLGTRRYECQVDSFPAGSELRIHVACSTQDDSGFGVFSCDIEENGTVLASARINAYSPPNINEYIHEEAPAP